MWPPTCSPSACGWLGSATVVVNIESWCIILVRKDIYYFVGFVSYWLSRKTVVPSSFILPPRRSCFPCCCRCMPRQPSAGASAVAAKIRKSSAETREVVSPHFSRNKSYVSWPRTAVRARDLASHDSRSWTLETSSGYCANRTRTTFLRFPFVLTTFMYIHIDIIVKNAKFGLKNVDTHIWRCHRNRGGHLISYWENEKPIRSTHHLISILSNSVVPFIIIPLRPL